MGRLTKERDEARKLAEEYRDKAIIALGDDYNRNGKAGPCSDRIAESIATLRRERDELRAKTSRVTLSVLEIFDLAAMAGLKIEASAGEDDEETEVTITPCPASGVIDEEDDGKAKGEPKHYKHVAYFEEYPEEGVCPLGAALDSASAKQEGAQP